MHNDKDLSTWQTFRRLWPTIAPFKAGLIVAGIALILNAASDTFMLSLLKPLLDDGFGKTDRSVLLWMPLVVIGLMILRGITSYISSYCISWGVRQSGNDHASSLVWPYDGNARRLL
ncbi:transport ATP-binding protein MsbA [Salmonella bongori]|nr:transport ATP-binding protein MsbA [Salmonella bongori]